MTIVRLICEVNIIKNSLFRLPAPRKQNDAIHKLVLIGSAQHCMDPAFIKDCSEKYDEVFLVIGHHNESQYKLSQEIVDNFGEGRVIILQRSGYDIIPGKVRIIGTACAKHNYVVDKISDLHKRCNNECVHNQISMSSEAFKAKQYMGKLSLIAFTFHYEPICGCVDVFNEKFSDKTTTKHYCQMTDTDCVVAYELVLAKSTL
jgi:hypothetical protein